MFKILLVCIILLFSAGQVYADCLACWQTRYVEIEYVDGHMENGFITWSNLYPKHSESLYQKEYGNLSDFCDTLHLYYEKNNDVLLLYKSIIVIEKHFPRTPICIGKIDTINMDFVHLINCPSNPKNDIEGAGMPVNITREQSELLLNKEPLAFYKTSGFGLSDAYYLSYDEKIGKEELIVINKNRDLNTEFKHEIILIEIHYD
ncbi:hypothetical protein N9231_02490 [Saprospiraceae bacterium]|nr:hypothetical protein [Saprospiraceae bacterium]